MSEQPAHASQEQRAASLAAPRLSLLTIVGIVGIALSYLYPGYRLANFPIYIPSLISVLFAPYLLRVYEAGAIYRMLGAFAVFLSIILYNSLIGIFAFRDWAYVTLPLGAVLGTAMVAYVSERIGIKKLIRLAVIGSLTNLVVMIAQAVDLFSVVTLFAPIWENAINFVSYDENQAQILWATLSIRPPGFFPTGIFSSTIIYISLRAHYALYKRYIVFVPITLAILLTANRTLAAFFVVFESYRLIAERGFVRFFIVASIVLVSVVVSLFILIEFDVNLYVIQFIFDEVLGGGLSQSGSVTGRLTTYDFFVSAFPRYALLGGFSSDDLAYYGGVFDSEIMLRTLQFGVAGTLALSAAILLPRRRGASIDWWFLPAMALAASLTTTLVTSVIYTVALALYREAVLYRLVPVTRPQ
ncbi:MAG TPA: hypothetical protein VF637_16740 [Sphingomicrobium sp.]|jgi:hypothetical protein